MSRCYERYSTANHARSAIDLRDGALALRPAILQQPILIRIASILTALLQHRLHVQAVKRCTVPPDFYLADLCRIGVEGTGVYGASLARVLCDHAFEVGKRPYPHLKLPPKFLAQSLDSPCVRAKSGSPLRPNLWLRRGSSGTPTAGACQRPYRKMRRRTSANLSIPKKLRSAKSYQPRGSSITSWQQREILAAPSPHAP